MTVPQPSESTRLAQLEQRVQALEDVNAIRHLKARYAASCDDRYNPQGAGGALHRRRGVGKPGSGALPSGTLSKPFLISRPAVKPHGPAAVALSEPRPSGCGACGTTRARSHGGACSVPLS